MVQYGILLMVVVMKINLKKVVPSMVVCGGLWCIFKTFFNHHRPEDTQVHYNSVEKL